jgi:alkylresorcinol/alkylpyrone synthase
MRIASVGRALPPHHYSQEDLLAEFRKLWAEKIASSRRLEQLHRSVLVGGRFLALPMEEYYGLQTFGQANDAWIRVGQELGEAAIAAALEACGAEPADIDALLFVSVTGISTPSLDARLINRMGMSPNLRRLPIFGLGCVAGAAGIARAADHLRAYPGHLAVLLSVELCSLTLQREDFSIANLISSGLFGDGAAAVALCGADHPLAARADGPEIVATKSIFYPDTEHVMGWDISERGFRVVLSADVPDMVRRHLRADVDAFLAEQGVERSEIASWVAHPGGPRVLEVMAEALEIEPSVLEPTWRSLEEVGNLSSTSVLLVLEDTMRSYRPEPGRLGMLLAMGPGFCSELVLLRW